MTTIRSYYTRTRLFAALSVAMLALLGAGAAAFAGVFDRTTTVRAGGGGTQVVRVALVDSTLGFDVVPDTIVVTPGTRLILIVENEGREDHDLVVAGGWRRTRLLHPGESQRLDAGTVRGDLTAWCTVPGHRLFGMSMAVRVATTG